MKGAFLFLLVIVSAVTFGQDNKPLTGDFGIRYGVAFNGTFAQTLALSGMVTKNWEVGVGFSISYSNVKTQSISTNEIDNGIQDISVTETATNIAKTLSATLIPYAVYHFPVKTNVDLYAGANLNIGTGSITLDHNERSEYTGNGYYELEVTDFKYPVGYQVGGAILVGCQYFFYKNLAVGVDANLGAALTVQQGPYTITEQTVNSGINNTNTINANSVTNDKLDNRTFSAKSASSAGVYLTFYFASKNNRKVKDSKAVQ